MERFVRSEILMKNSSAIKLMNFDLKKEEKLRDKCPLKYKKPVAISSLSATEITSLKTEHLKKKFTTLLEHFQDDGHIATTAAEKSLKQYIKLINNKVFLKEAKMRLFPCISSLPFGDAAIPII